MKGKTFIHRRDLLGILLLDRGQGGEDVLGLLLSDVRLGITALLLLHLRTSGFKHLTTRLLYAYLGRPGDHPQLQVRLQLWFLRHFVP